MMSMATVQSSDGKFLEAKATLLLRAAGYTGTGLLKTKVSGAQTAFERRLICTVPPGSGKKRR